MDLAAWLTARPSHTTVRDSGRVPLDKSRNRMPRTTLGVVGALLPDDEPVLHLVAKPRVLFVNKPLLQRLGLDAMVDRALMQMLGLARAPSSVPPGSPVFPVPPMPHAFAWCYAGVQFGVMAGQLGDGRACTVVEFGNGDAPFGELQLKGGLKTPYSRSLDGQLAARSAVKEILLLEYLHALGLPTSRGLAVSLNGGATRRDADLNVKTATVARTVTSGVRIGTFEAQFYTRRHDVLKELADFVIEVHFAHAASLPEQPPVAGSKYHAFLRAAAENVGRMVAGWDAFGFVHGVMNSDNISIHGEALDIGPACMLEDWYDADFTRSADDDHKMYSFGRQREAGRKAVERLALALSPLFQPDDESHLKQAKAALADGIAGYKMSYDDTLVETTAKRLGVSFVESDVKRDIAGATWSALKAAGATRDSAAWQFHALFRTVELTGSLPSEADFAEADALRTLWREHQLQPRFPSATNPALVPTNELVAAAAYSVCEEAHTDKEASTRMHRLVNAFSAPAIFSESSAQYVSGLVKRAPSEVLQQCGCG
jgi:uncharacterized protein YdiU (UPF0061 family)